MVSALGQWREDMPKKQPSLATLKKEVHLLYGTKGKKDEDEAFRAGLVLLSSAFLGPSIPDISDFTGVPEEQISEWASNLERSGIWRGGKVYVDWFDKDGGVAFLCDTLVMQGLLKRA